MSTELALQLADEIIGTQGAVFVRELLRTLKHSGAPVAIGIRKVETVANLRTAILANVISYDDLVTWLRSVEGWGHQHVYMYKLLRSAAQHTHWQEPVPQRLLDHAQSVRVPIANERRQVLQFPAEFRLGRIGYDGEKFELVWRKGVAEWRRDASRDEERTIDDDLYRFQAWRETPQRAVVRFVCFPHRLRAALFIQQPLGEEHRLALEMAEGVIRHFCPPAETYRVDLSDCLKDLDVAGQAESGSQLASARGTVRPQSTTFRALGASIAFHAADLPSYSSVPAVRRVRLALQENEFNGESGTFNVDLNGGPGMNRTVKMTIDGRSDRAYFYARMNEDEVWSVLDHMFDLLA